jgi:hypothetical protein
MVEGNFWLVSGKIFDFTDVTFGSGTFVLSEVNLLCSELFDEWVESEEVYVLKMVIGSVHLLEFFWGLSWIDALKDA